MAFKKRDVEAEYENFVSNWNTGTAIADRRPRTEFKDVDIFSTAKPLPHVKPQTNPTTSNPEKMINLNDLAQKHYGPSKMVPFEDLAEDLYPHQTEDLTFSKVCKNIAKWTKKIFGWIIKGLKWAWNHKGWILLGLAIWFVLSLIF